MRTKDGRDLPVLEITADNYIVPQGEEMTVHAKIEVRQFDPKTGNRISTPRIQKFGMKEWQSVMQSSLRKQGYTVEILHDPFKFAQEHAAQVAATQAAKAKAAQVAAEAKKAAELAAIKEQAKAELMAELKAAGVIPQTQDGAQAAQESAQEAKRPGRPSSKDKE